MTILISRAGVWLFVGCSLSMSVGAQVVPNWIAGGGNSWGQPGALCYDPVRQRCVYLSNGDTWEWDGATWLIRMRGQGPSARTYYQMVYDAARARIVLFGGGKDGPLTLFGDTWEWDGAAWLQRFPATSPSPRLAHAMAYDSARRRVVLFGGANGSANGFLGDTWEYDGTNWTAISVTPSPSPRSLPTMAYDASRMKTVLYGGHNFSAIDLAAWEWDGAQWSSSSASGPATTSDNALSYNSVRQRVVLFVYKSKELWEWDGTNWILRDSSAPDNRGAAAMAYDAGRQRLVLHGGGNYSETWEWNDVAWSLRANTRTPAALVYRGYAIDYDSARAQAVMYGSGGSGASQQGRETWLLSNGQWVQAASGLLYRNQHALSYDSGRGSMVLFGGSWNNGQSTNLYANTEEWNGELLVSPCHEPEPPARYNTAMAYDATRQVTVLFGGQSTSGVLGDTWEWNGASWTQRAPASSPPPRASHGMAYDAARQRVVLFGGSGRGDTWEWDGNAWAAKTAATQPPAQACKLVHDARRQLVVLVGGSGTWEWNGSAWTQTTASTPAPYAGAFYDSIAARVVAFASSIPWFYGALVPASASPFGTGCAGTAGIPVLNGVMPALGNGAFLLDLVSARASSACLFALSATSAVRPIGACTLYVGDPVVQLLAVTSQLGGATLRLPIPLDGALRGAPVYAQGVVADPLAPGLGLTFSSGLKLVIGDG